MDTLLSSGRRRITIIIQEHPEIKAQLEKVRQAEFEKCILKGLFRNFPTFYGHLYSIVYSFMCVFVVCMQYCLVDIVGSFVCFTLGDFIVVEEQRICTLR